MGQSVMRYQYLWLRQFVEENPQNVFLHKICDSRFLADFLQRGGMRDKDLALSPALRNDNEAKRWLMFFQNSSTSREVCDCGRPEGFKNPFVENRFYFHSSAPDKSFKISFYWVIGDQLSFGHIGFENRFTHRDTLRTQLYKKCCKTCGEFCPKNDCNLQKYPGNCFMPIEARSIQKKYKVSGRNFGSTSNRESGFWSKSIDELVRDISKVHKPKVLILGTLYSWLECDEVSRRRKIDILKEAKSVSPETESYYRTCPTVKVKGSNEALNHDDICFREASEISGWSIFDTNYMIKRLWEFDPQTARESYYDHIHFKCFVYREFNNFLLNRVCNTL